MSGWIIPGIPLAVLTRWVLEVTGTPGLEIAGR
jgi:hypothetical protein